MSDFGLKALLRGDNEFESSKMVVSIILVYRFGMPHLKKSQLILLSPLYTQSGISKHSYHKSLSRLQGRLIKSDEMFFLHIHFCSY